VKKGVFLYLFVLLTLLSLSVGAEGQENDLFSKIGIQTIKDKKEAPPFSLENIEGKKVELKNFKGKIVFINFWATWCGPCKEEMPSMEALYKQFREKGFVLLSISVDYAGLKPVKEFIEKNHYTFPVLIDQKCKVLDLYQVNKIPATFIINKKGKMVGKAIAPKNWTNPDVFALMDQLLKEK
jgi:peroxiredoxin